MKKILGLAALAVFLLPMLGFSDGTFSFRLGYFIPSAKSDLWNIEFENMSFEKHDFEAVTFGMSYEYFMTREFSLVFGADYYGRSQYGYYRDWVGYTIDGYDYAFPYSSYDGDYDISHQFRTWMSPFQISIKLSPFGRRSGIIPYIGGGVSFYLWSVALEGDMVDFEDQYVYEDPDLGDVDVYGIVFTDAHEHTNFDVGFHAFAGITIPIAPRTAIEAEFRYNYAKGGLHDAFRDFNSFDLGGYQISVGLNYWF
jgi:hypothetical protein